MKTLHVDTGRRMQGGQWQVVYLLERLEPRLENVRLLAPAGSPLLEEARRRGIDAEEFSVWRMRAHGREADLVHAHDARSHALAALLAKKPIVVSRRVAFPIGTSIASKWKYGRGAMYLAVSKFVAGLLTEAGVAPERIRVVYDGVPLPQRSRIESRREPGRVVALEGKCQEIVRAAAAAAGVPVHFTSSLWEDLSTASIFIYASPLEGLGSAALAAMAAGVPVIASGRGGLEEAVEHQVTGLVVAPEGIAPPEGIAKALRKLLDDPAGAAEMGRRGRERVERKFTVEAMVEATRKAYDEVLG